MRICPSAERTLLGGASLSHHTKVEIQNASGSWIDLTTIGGRNWVNAWAIDEDVDTPVRSLTLTLQAAHGALSLHPLRSDSALNVDDAAAYAPLIFAGRRIRVYVGVGDADAAVPSSPWRMVFEGITEEPDAPDKGKLVTVNARDLGVLLLDRFIEQETVYSTPDGVDVEVIIQQMITQHTAGLAISITLGLPNGSPNWRIRQYKQAPVPVLEAIRTLAQQIGWDVRYRWRTDTPDANALELQLYDPARAKTVVDWTLPPAEYFEVSSLKFGDRNVRNVVGIWFYDSALGGALRYLEVVDAASVAVFGRRYMQLSESATSNIDTATEALAMITAALSDLSTPYADQQIRTFDLWFAEVGDLIGFPANAVHYNADQKFAAVSINRSWAKGVATLTLRTRGKPAGAYSDWIRKHGRGPTGRGVPAPFFGIPQGEDSEGGGVSGDGMIWLEVHFEPGTLWVDVYVEERVDDQVPVPEVGEITRAWRLYRQPGKTSQDLYWKTWLGMATRPLWFKRIRAIGYNAAGEAGPEYITDPVQAIDPVAPAIVDGVVADLQVQRNTATTVTVDVDVGAVDPNTPSFLMIVRNGIVIAPLFIGVQSGKHVTYLDEELDPAGIYTYDAFIWTNGVSGAHFLMPTPPVPPVPPEVPGAGNIVWRDPSPDLVIRLVNSAFTQFTRALYSHDITGITKVCLQRSADGLGGWVDVVIQQTTAKVGELLYNSAAPAWYRFRAANADDSIEVFSAMRQLVRPTKPPPPADTAPTFINGSPRLNAAGDAVLLDYLSAVTGFDHMVLESSTDYTTWTDEATSTAATGQFSDSDLTAKWYRLRAEDAADGLLRYGGIVWWNGVSVPVLDSPPVILPGYPQVVDVLGVPTMKIGYDSNISWFARMRLQASADGQTWTNITTDNNPSGFFLYATASAQWFRVRAEDSLTTRALHSLPVWFPGLSPTGGDPDTTPPDFTLAVWQVGGVPQLVVSWTCANVDGRAVTIETSADDGATFGWLERHESAAVAAGNWQFGDWREETYYRMTVRDEFDNVLATSGSKYWAGQIHEA